MKATFLATGLFALLALVGIAGGPVDASPNTQMDLDLFRVGTMNNPKSLTDPGIEELSKVLDRVLSAGHHSPVGTLIDAVEESLVQAYGGDNVVLAKSEATYGWEYDPIEDRLGVYVCSSAL